MALPAKKAEQRFTYADYLSWDDGERAELIDGVVYCMTPAPTVRHQRVAGEIFFQIKAALRGQRCEAFFAALDVRLAEADETDEQLLTVVQPDVFVVCDPGKIEQDGGCRGAPDFVAEVLSPSTAAKDQREKMALYERHGVREFWIVDPVHCTVAIRVLGANGKYGAPTIVAEGEVELEALPGVRVDLSLVFPSSTRSR